MIGSKKAAGGALARSRRRGGRRPGCLRSGNPRRWRRSTLRPAARSFLEAVAAERPRYRRATFALICVEHREAFEKRNRAGLFAALCGSLSLIVRRETVGKDHGRPVFAFSHIAADAKRLSEREPALTRKSAFDDRPLEDEHVDARVAPLRRGVLRYRERRPRRRSPPRLNPGNAPSLQFGDHLVGDFGIEARPVVTRTGARC